MNAAPEELRVLEVQVSLDGLPWTLRETHQAERLSELRLPVLDGNGRMTFPAILVERA